MATESAQGLIMGKLYLHTNAFSFDPILIKLAGNKDMHKISEEFEFQPDQTTPFEVRCLEHLKNFPLTYNGKMAPSVTFIFDWIFIKLVVTMTGIKSQTSSKLADNLSSHKISRVQNLPKWTIYFGVTCLDC